MDSSYELPIVTCEQITTIHEYNLSANIKCSDDITHKIILEDNYVISYNEYNKTFEVRETGDEALLSDLKSPNDDVLKDFDNTSLKSSIELGIRVFGKPGIDWYSPGGKMRKRSPVPFLIVTSEIIERSDFKELRGWIKDQRFSKIVLINHINDLFCFE